MGVVVFVGVMVGAMYVFCNNLPSRFGFYVSHRNQCTMGIPPWGAGRARASGRLAFLGGHGSPLLAGELLNTLAGHTGEVLSVAISQDGTMVASGSSDKTVRLWNPQTGMGCLPDAPWVRAGGRGHGWREEWAPHPPSFSVWHLSLCGMVHWMMPQRERMGAD